MYEFSENERILKQRLLTGGESIMLQLGNEAQVRSALEGKSGFQKEIEDELIRRIAIAETEQDSYEPLSKGQWWAIAGTGIIGVILAIISLIV